MNRRSLEKHGKSWVNQQIITEEQYKKILKLYPRRTARPILMIFAVLFMSIGFLTFIFSDWAQVPHYSRILIIIILLVSLYFIGDYQYRKNDQLIGISILSIAYVMFGAGLLLAIDIYNIILFSAWPYVIWSVIALLLYIVYKHRWLYSIGIIVTTIGQIASHLLYSSFNLYLFLLLILGFAHYAYHQRDKLYGYLVGVSYVIQIIGFIIVNEQQYYFLIVYFLLLYGISQLIRQHALSPVLERVSVVSMFFLAMYQTFVFQNYFFIENEYEFSFIFLIAWLFIFSLSSVLHTVYRDYEKFIHLLLFLPIIYLPGKGILSLIILFLFSLGWLIVGYLRENSNYVLFGSIAFLLSTFTAYIQYAWDVMDKSLFFIVGGILLFVMGILIDRQRRQFKEDHEGDLL